jgi:oxygen-independent coproporphyrinogen-3 oxidase
MPQFEKIDLQILRKYSVPGPRYTSYPTAPLFNSVFGPPAYHDEIIRTNQAGDHSNLSVYVHLPFCDTLCYFCGCTMKVTRRRSSISEYNQYLKKEVELIAPLVNPERKVIQLHWGGGTPSYLDPEEILDLGSYIRQHFHYSGDIEAGVEIDPRGLTLAHMQAFREAGFNRVSMGVQDFNLQVQESVNRVQSEDITRDAVNWSRQLGFGSINLDLIYGLPHQSVESFGDTVEKIISISPDRIAVFNYAHVPWLKPHQKIIDEQTLPSAELKLEIFKMTIEKLTGAGYWNIGMDHFAKPSDELYIAQKNKSLHRNFQGYSTKAGCDLYGFGMSAIGHFRETYQQNTKNIPQYYKMIDKETPATQAGYRMSPDDHIRKEVIMRIMCDMEIDKVDVERKTGVIFDEYFAGAISKLKIPEQDGLVAITPEKIIVRGMGRLMVRNIAMCFDAFVDTLMKDRPIFSKTL